MKPRIKMIHTRHVLFTCAACLFLLAGQSAGAFPDGANVVVDAKGRRISIEKPFQRIISLYTAHTENLFSLGLDAAILGVSPSETHPPEALAKPVFSYRDDPEKFLAARPDLVLIRPMIDNAYPLLVERLEKSGIAVVSLQPSAPGELYGYWQALGRLTGTEAAAEKMIASFKERLLEIEKRLSGLPGKKRVYFEAVGRRMKTFSPASITLFVLASAGGVNVATDAEPSRGTNIAFYGKERILSHADAIDVYIAQKGPMNPTSVEAILAEPGFSAIRAVREGRILLVEEELVSRPTLRLLEGIDRIARHLYPERFQGDDR